MRLGVVGLGEKRAWEAEGGALNPRNTIKYGRRQTNKTNDNHSTHSRSTISSANNCVQPLSSVLDFGFPVGFSAVGLDLGPSRALTSGQIDSLSCRLSSVVGSGSISTSICLLFFFPGVSRLLEYCQVAFCHCSRMTLAIF